MKTRISTLRLPRLRDERGVSVIEVVVAMAVLVVGMLGMASAFNSSRKLTLLSERRTSMAHRAQLELERMQATSYAELAMSSTSPPTHSSVETNPDYYVKEGTPAEYQYGTAKSESEKLAESTNGAISASPTGRECSSHVGACEWTDGNISGSVYDFVTWYGEPSKLCKEESKCPKRLTVVVTTKVPSGSREPASVKVSTVVAEPSS